MNLMLAGSITCFVTDIAELKTLDFSQVLVRPYVGSGVLVSVNRAA